MEEKPSVSVSVRNIVEFVLRRGDINSAALSPRSDLQQGTRIHRRIQKAEQQKGRYRAEVRLSHTEDLGDMTLTVQGIADGIIETDSGVIVDEIKSTAVALEAIDENFNFLHKAQACFYAYFYACDNGLDMVTVRLSYSHIKTNEIKYFTYEMTFDQLRELFDSVRDRYAVWARFTMASEKAARSSAKALKFPFSDYRQGQRELSASVFRAIRDTFCPGAHGTGQDNVHAFRLGQSLRRRHGTTYFLSYGKKHTPSRCGGRSGENERRGA